MIKSLHVLNCGSIPVDKGVLATYRVDMGKTIVIPFRSFLIKADDGHILFDASFNPETMKRLIAMGKKVNVTEEDSMLNRLAEIGVSPKDVSTVFLSHLHYEHCGLLNAFTHADIILQRAEYAYGLNAPSYVQGVYLKADFDLPGLKWRLLDGDEFLMPGLTAIHTIGHTPGHQSLMVDLPKTGTVILSGDAAVCKENIEKEIITGIFYNPDDTLYAIKKLKLLAQMKNAEIIFSHDPEWQTMPTEYN
ncbi:N-acyl homoserine lactonase family protein [Chloroflexota bacterium]